MKKLKYILILLLIIALPACGSPSLPASAQAATPSEEVIQPSAMPVNQETAIPATEAAVSSTATEFNPPASGPVSFRNDVQPILNARCIKCHGVDSTKAGLDLQTYESILTGSRKGSVIQPANAADSLLVKLIAAGEMPSRGDPVTTDELQLITDWINQGAANN